MDYNEIIELFKYNDIERKSFDYIDRYSKLIEDWLKNNRLDNNQLLRYILIGFFIYYRAANHQGETFNTKEETLEEFEESQQTIDDMMKSLESKYPEKFITSNMNSNNYPLKENFIKRQKKNKIFNELYGKTINSTNEYLNLIKINDFENDSGLKFFDFIING